MQYVSARLCLLLLILFHSRTSVGLKEMDKVSLEVIVNSSPCSTTCGLGLKTQMLCLLKDSERAMEEDVRSKHGTEVSSGWKVSEECHVRKVTCLESWQCGLRTMSVTSGQRVEIDCLEEVMEVMGKFSFRVLWRYARGIITSDDSLFAHWEAPELDRVILDPISEEDAGTYCCDVQDTSFRLVKRAYWGIRVLPVGVISLNYERSVAQWDSSGNQQVTKRHDYRRTLLYMPQLQPLITEKLSPIGKQLPSMDGGQPTPRCGKSKTQMKLQQPLTKEGTPEKGGLLDRDTHLYSSEGVGLQAPMMEIKSGRIEVENPIRDAAASVAIRAAKVADQAAGCCVKQLQELSRRVEELSMRRSSMDEGNSSLHSCSQHLEAWAYVPFLGAP
ncbi:transmembrane protein 81 [Mastacembelus armatus]|uniref:transmembrane protein 81 n=1 Tax=Mastacembelus armatus TaxID=205130 RepID=UPI000E455301|nr:transmembrane protein 81 [Mastacembelus armatus]